MRAKVSSAARAAAGGIGETVDIVVTHAISPNPTATTQQDTDAPYRSGSERAGLATHRLGEQHAGAAVG